MNTVLKVFLSMSASGTLLILVFFAGKRLLADKLSRQWQYYIWLIVIARLMLPFGPETSLLGSVYQAADRRLTETAPPPQAVQGQPESMRVSPEAGEPGGESVEDASEDRLPLREIVTFLGDRIWVVWLGVALILLIRKLTIYQSFVRYVKAGLCPVSDIEYLDRLSEIAERSGINRPVELGVNPLLSSPLLVGWFRPCIMLPGADCPEPDFGYIVLHELTHYRRRDMLYKWLVQLAVCLHWFNPFVYLMSREITRACEFSCDEAVLAAAGYDSAPDYGRTLLDAMAAVGKYRESVGMVPLNENKRLLKERLGAIMNFRKKSGMNRMLTGVLTMCVCLAAVFVGVCPAEAAPEPAVSQGKSPVFDADAARELSELGKKKISASEAKRYYEAGSLPLFGIAFSRMNETQQEEWMEKIYADDDIAFFSVCVDQLKAGSQLIQRFAKKAYQDGEIAFFSVLADRMSEKLLEKWLDRALADQEISFQAMLYDKLDREDELDGLEKELDEQRAKEYKAHGITVDGKNYYYKGKLVNIFLDIRQDSSFYTLNINPKGTVNIKVTRNKDGKIKKVSYMTEKEVEELLGDMSDDDDLEQETAGGRIWHPQVLPVNYKTMGDGEIVWLGEYTLSEGDRIWYDVSAETGNGLQVGFAKPGDTHLNTTYYSVNNLRQQEEALKCTASFTVRPPVQPGTYRLFIRATDGALGNVKGSISIGFVADSLPDNN